MCNGHLADKYNFVNFPIYMGTTTQDSSEDQFCDMAFSSCGDCGTVQLKNLIPLEILYKESHAGVVGKTWDEHHNKFCDFISQYTSGNLVEIGGSNLKVANILAKLDSVKKITVFDNQISFENLKSDKIVPKEEFFDVSKVASDTDCIIHTHLIEHLYTPLKQIQEISDALSVGSYMMFAAPLIDNMLDDYFTNAMNFEHTYLLTKKKIEYMMSEANFEIIDVFDFSKYAAFYVCEKTNSSSVKYLNFSEFKDNDTIYNFLSYHLEEVKNIKAQINTSKENTFIFGAHIFTQYLLNFGLEEGLFANILDNDPNKIDNRLYGTNLFVRSPKILKNYESPLVILKAAQYTEEIKQDILENINPNTRFIL